MQLFKRKTKQPNEWKQTNLEKQKMKQNLLSLSTWFLYFFFFFSICISFSYTLDDMGENLSVFLHFNHSKNIPRSECNLSASSKFIAMNCERLTLGQVPTSSLPAVDEKGQPADDHGSVNVNISQRGDIEDVHLVLIQVWSIQRMNEWTHEWITLKHKIYFKSSLP